MAIIQQHLLHTDMGGYDWITTFGRTGGAGQWPGGIDVDSDGNIYCCGHGRTSADTSWPYEDGVRIKLVKFNKIGEHQWSREIGTGDQDDGGNMGRAVSVSPDGERVAVVSSSYSNPNGTPGGQPVDSYSGIHIAMYNKSGSIQWQRWFDKMEIEGVGVPYGGSYHDIPEDVYEIVVTMFMFVEISRINVDQVQEHVIVMLCFLKQILLVQFNGRKYYMHLVNLDT